MIQLPQTWELFDAARDRLERDDTLRALLGGAGRVKKVTDEHSAPEDREDKYWGRVVLIPPRTLWNIATNPHEGQRVQILVRADVHPPRASKFDPARSLAAIHSRAFELLHDWTPREDAFQHLLVSLPLYLYSAPQGFPFWDDQAGTWFQSAEYRTEARPAPHEP